MNYKKIYDSLIERSQNRELIGYYEIHHIIPKCMGGLDDIDNLTKLTAEEHYIAHQLLVKIYPNNPKLVKAAIMMIPNRPSNKLYGWLRRKFSEIQAVNQSGIGNSQYGTKWIHNPITFQNKKIKNISEVEEGWLLGRYVPSKNKTIKYKISKREENKKMQIEIHRQYYKLYKIHGFTEFVKLTGYKKTKANLVQRFSKLLPEFLPQNGKKRGLI